MTEASLRDGVFLARELLADQPEPLFPNVREAAVQNLADPIRIGPASRGARGRSVAPDVRLAAAGQGLFEPKPGERELLWAAAMLHDVGMTISYDDHHKHSHYLIVSAELPGFDPRERALIAQISRYHRKGAPSSARSPRLPRRATSSCSSVAR